MAAPMLPVRDGSMEYFNKVMELNLKAPIHLTKMSLPHLEKTKGNIIMVSSAAGNSKIMLLI